MTIVKVDPLAAHLKAINIGKNSPNRCRVCGQPMNFRAPKCGFCIKDELEHNALRRCPDCGTAMHSSAPLGRVCIECAVFHLKIREPVTRVTGVTGNCNRERNHAV